MMSKAASLVGALAALASVERVGSYPLLEASGVQPFAQSGWDLLVPGDELCGTNESGALLLSSNSSDALLLQGPTAHTVGEGTVPPAPAPWRAGVAVGNRVVLLPANGGKLAVVDVAAGCGSIASVRWASGLPQGEWTGAAVLPKTDATIFTTLSPGSGQPHLVALDLAFEGGAAKATVRQLAPIALGPGCAVRGLAASAKRGTLIVAAHCDPAAPGSCKPDPATAKQKCGPVAAGCGHAKSPRPYQYGNPSYGIFCCAHKAVSSCNSGPCCAVHGTQGNDCSNYDLCDTWVNKTWSISAPTPTVLELDSTGKLLNETHVSVQNDSNWAGVVVIDAAGDGREQILLPRQGGVDDGGERTAIVDWDPTSGELVTTVPHLGTVLGPAGKPGVEMDGIEQIWKHVSSASWLGGGDDQLLALRKYNASLSGTQQACNVLIFGSAMHVLPRRMAVSNTLAQEETWGPLKSRNGSLDIAALMAVMTKTHTNTHNPEVCAADDWTQLITELIETKDFFVDGHQFRLWVELLPPTEAHPGGDDCQPPPDDPRTPFNETAIFNYSTTGFLRNGTSTVFPYWDYPAWGEVLGRLAAMFPHLVCLEIDDFTHDVAPDEHGIFTPHVLSLMQSNLHKHSPSLNWAGNVYFSEEGAVYQEWPDLSLIGDTMLYYFRNQKEGAGPCAPATCKWGPSDDGSHEGGCLAGACAEPTVANVAEEVKEIVAWLPAGRRVIVGFYATGHSSLGSPSTRYVKEIIPAILDQPGVGGIMFYTMLAPCGLVGAEWPHGEICVGGPPSVEIDLCAKGCAVRDAFAVAAVQ